VPAILALAAVSIGALVAAPLPVRALGIGDDYVQDGKIRWQCAFWTEVWLEPSDELEPPPPGPDVSLGLFARLRIKNPGNRDNQGDYYLRHPHESCVPVRARRVRPEWIGKVRIDLFRVVSRGPDERLRRLLSAPFSWKHGEPDLLGWIFRTRMYCGEGIDGVGTRYYARVKVKRKHDPVPLVLRTPKLKAENAWDCLPLEDP
jgi:hypothetical protein